MFGKSAKLDLSASWYSSHSGMCQARSHARSPRVEDLARKRVAVGEQPGGDATQGAHDFARQRRDVDDSGGLVSARRRLRASHRTRRPSESVSRISTVWPDIVVTMSPGLIALPPGMFSVARDDADDVERQLQERGRVKRAEHARAAAHVEFHLVHLERGLDGDAARVERDALADEHDGRVPAAPRVLHHDELRRLAAAARDREEAAHAELLEILLFEDLRPRIRRARRRRAPARRDTSACRDCRAGCRDPWRARCPRRWPRRERWQPRPLRPPRHSRGGTRQSSVRVPRSERFALELVEAIQCPP